MFPAFTVPRFAEIADRLDTSILPAVTASEAMFTLSTNSKLATAASTAAAVMADAWIAPITAVSAKTSLTFNLAAVTALASRAAVRTCPVVRLEA